MYFPYAGQMFPKHLPGIFLSENKGHLQFKHSTGSQDMSEGNHISILLHHATLNRFVLQDEWFAKLEVVCGL